MARHLSFRRPRLIGRDELAWRARVLARTEALRLATALRPPRWNRETIDRVLAPGLLTAGERRAIEARDWAAIEHALLNRLRGRASRFLLDHVAADALAAQIRVRWPGAAAGAAARGNEILAGRYDLLAYRGLSFANDGHAVDWHRDPVHGKRAPDVFWADVPYLDPAIVGDHKIIWEINRHQHWLPLGRALWLTHDSKYGSRILGELESWLAANPPLRGINWASMLELGLRAISWTWGLHFLLAASQTSDFRLPTSEGPWLLDMFVALDRQLTHVEHNLSHYFSPNTHLTGEALALYVVGQALPELAGSARWTARGRAILLREIDRQILADGGHAERSTHYHRYTLDIYLFALLMARRVGDEEAAVKFGAAAAKLAEFARALADDRGVLPLIGDDDGGMIWPITGRDCRDIRDSLALAAVILGRPELAPWGIQEEVFWLAGSSACGYGEHAAVAEEASRTFPDTGYVVMRDGTGGHAVFDVGAHGYMNGGHAHADALAITLGTANRALLIDPGTASYTLDLQLRDRMRRSMSHNTVEIDGRSQSIPNGPFHWQTRTDARLHGDCHNPAFDWAEAYHDGYAPARHRRTVFRSPASGWLIADHILGSGSHSAATYWHFDPEWIVTPDGPARLRATHSSGDVVWLLHDAERMRLEHGDDRSGLGWTAPIYGLMIPTWSAEMTRRNRAPFAMLTWIGTSLGNGSPSLERLETTCDTSDHRLAARIVDGDFTSVFLLRPGEDASPVGRSARVLDYDTNARVLHYAMKAGTLVRLDIVDATVAVSTHADLLSIRSEAPIGDLDIEIGAGILDVRSSEPPARVILEGDTIAAEPTVRLNGSALAAGPARIDERTLAIERHEWTSSYSRCPAMGSKYSASAHRSSQI
jgi:hypothetical protein